MTNRSMFSLLPWMAIFFLAMAFLESAVVVYLRALYYPGGFGFPIIPMSKGLVRTELWREVATLVMLLAPGAMVTRSALERFAWFCFGFGVWDLGYYFWLKLLLDWPASWQTWDLLFLVPFPWVGPVWAPCLIALGLIILSMYVFHIRNTGSDLQIPRSAWSLLIIGALLMICSFMLDPMMHGFNGSDMMYEMPTEQGTVGRNTREMPYVPFQFPWAWYLAGWLFAFAGMILLMRSHSASRS